MNPTEGSAIVPHDYDKRPHESRRTKDSTFDRIYKFYHNSKTKIILEAWEEDIRTRWEASWFLLIRAKTQKDVADEIEKIFRVSKSIAYDDVRHAMMLFGDPRQNLKSAKQAIAESIALKGLEYAEKKQDLPMMDRFLQKYIDIGGLISEGFDSRLEEIIKKLKATQIIISSTPEQLSEDANKIHDDLMKDLDKISVE